jgi:hypothetical protein
LSRSQGFKVFEDLDEIFFVNWNFRERLYHIFKDAESFFVVFQSGFWLRVRILFPYVTQGICDSYFVVDIFG